MMNNSSNNTLSKKSASAKQAMDNMKYEVANQIGVNLKQGYNGDLTSREAGYVGGYMVKKMIESVEQGMSNK
ncbi:MAG: alpha/beta-type small acid-soluble spore protein [Christensenellales bacterium]|jgi:hypothetical protein